MFSSGFVLVSTCAMKGIVCDRRVWPMLYSVSVEGMLIGFLQVGILMVEYL